MITLASYRLTGCIGRGAMGEVWAATHATGGWPVAIKVLTDERAQQDRYRAAFRTEVRAVAGLDHPGIVRVFDAGEVPPGAAAASRGQLVAGSPYLVMEMLDGPGLSGAWDWPRLRDALGQLLAALAHAHARGVVHRDLKPDNVLTDGRLLKLTDFGVSHAGDEDGPVSSTAGTPGFMAPEQIQGDWRSQGPWTDLYALGCLAFALTTGRPAFGGASPVAAMVAHLTDPAPPFVPRFPVPTGFADWIDRLLCRAPRARFQRAADAAHALALLGAPSAVAGEVPVLAAAPTPTVPFSSLTTPEPMPGPTLELPRLALPSAPPDGPPPEAPPVPPTWRGVASAGPDDRVGPGIFGLRLVPFVGREAERDQLWSALRAVADAGRPRAVVIRGPAGYGKTRLASWFAGRAHEVGAAHVLWADHADCGGPGHGLGAMLGRFWRCQGLPRPVARARLIGLLDDPVEATAIAEIVAPGEGVGGATFANPDEVFGTLHGHLARLASTRPVVVVLDDVQWGRQAIGFARAVLNRAALPVLFVLTAQDEALAERLDCAARLAALQLRSDCAQLTVGPLPRPVRPALARALLALEPELAGRLDAHTEGNPLFAVQLVQHWVQRQVLVPGEGGYRLRRGARVELPDDVLQVWRHRVGRLLAGRPASDGVALEVAAALGSAVDVEVWRAASARVGVSPTPTLVEALLDAALATCPREGTARRWQFVHGMLRSALRRRARDAHRSSDQHRACAATLAARGRPAEAEQVAEHWIAAGASERALEPLLAAADHHLARGEQGAAAALVDRREALLVCVGPPLEDPRWTAGWLRAARAARMRGDLPEADRWMARAREATPPALLTRTLLARGELARDHGLYAHAEGLLVEAAARAEAEADADAGAQAAQALGVTRLRRGDRAGAAEAFDKARTAWRAAGDALRAATCDYWLARCALQAEDTAGAQRTLARARGYFEHLGALGALAACDNLAGDLARLRGDLAVAARCFAAAAQGWERLGAGNARVARANEGLTLLEAGRPGDARPVLRDAIAAFEADRQWAMAAVCHAGMAACVAALGDRPAFDHHLERVDALVERTGITDPDIARALDRAAATWAPVDAPRSRAAHALAADQWRALGRPEEVTPAPRTAPLYVVAAAR